MTEDMKDKIAEIIKEHRVYLDGVDHNSSADAIVAALPSMVVPLVWAYFPANGWGIGVAISENDAEIQINRTDFGWSYGGVAFCDLETAQAKAQAHQTKQIMAAFGGEAK